MNTLNKPPFPKQICIFTEKKNQECPHMSLLIAVIQKLSTSGTNSALEPEEQKNTYAVATRDDYKEQKKSPKTVWK